MKSNTSAVKRSVLAVLVVGVAGASSQAMADRSYRDDHSYWDDHRAYERDRDFYRQEDGRRHDRVRDNDWRESRGESWRDHDRGSDRESRGRDHVGGNRWWDRDHDNRRDSNRRFDQAAVTGHVDQIEDLSERVKNSLRKSNNVKRSGLGRLDGLLSAFDAQANQLRSSWKSRNSASSIRPIINDLMSKSREIDREMSRRSVNGNTRNYWESLQSELRSLSRSVD